MWEVRPRGDRGYSDYGWLKTYQTFSFGNYYDPAHDSYSVLRVLNEDRLEPGSGFTPHEHHDVEIVTYMLAGALRHQDSLGHTATLRAGEFQRISAGAGMTHSEINPSLTEGVHLLQIWVLPSTAGGPSDYAQRALPRAERWGRPVLVASPDGAEGSFTLRQDCRLHVLALQEGQRATHATRPDRRLYLHVVEGLITVNGQALVQGDGLRVEDEAVLEFQADSPCEVLIFEMP
jgi:redox-sensitive bicupin YhaK (pirin superfamily)